MSVAAFIAAQRAQHQMPHATVCRALGFSQAWFYKWRHGDASHGGPGGNSWATPSDGRYPPSGVVATFRYE